MAQHAPAGDAPAAGVEGSRPGGAGRRHADETVRYDERVHDAFHSVRSNLGFIRSVRFRSTGTVMLTRNDRHSSAFTPAAAQLPQALPSAEEALPQRIFLFRHRVH